MKIEADRMIYKYQSDYLFILDKVGIMLGHYDWIL